MEVKRAARRGSGSGDWEDGQLVVSLLVPQGGWLDHGGEAESLTPDSDIDSGVFSQESGARQQSSEGESEEEEEDGDLASRPRTPFTRRVWNRQNGWYKVRPNPGAWHSSGQGRDLRAELEQMRREIAEMLDDTRELDERQDSEECSDASEEEEEEEEEEVSNNVEELYYDFDSSDSEEEEDDEEEDEGVPGNPATVTSY